MPLARRCTDALLSGGIDFRTEQGGTLRVPARCAELGDLVVSFDDEEVTVFLGSLTHLHFTPGAVGNPDAVDPIEECIGAAVEFVRDVLNDRWIIWSCPNGIGGCYRIGSERDRMADTPLAGERVFRFLWSGPVPRSTE